ncbi:MAG TPA: GTP-binding protein, partial [Humisphaera sp.]
GRMAVVVVNPAPARDAEALRPACAAVEAIAATVPEPAEVRGAVAKVLAARPKVVVVEACGGIAPFPDVGEDATVAMMCVSGGDDKADEYRALVARADLVLLGKADLAPYVSFDAAVFRADVHRHNPLAQVVELSVTDGRNLGKWVTWLEERAAAKRRVTRRAARPPGTAAAPHHGR